MFVSEVRTRRFWLVAIFILSIFGILLVHHLRSLELQGSLVQLVLGSAPNLLSGVGVPAAVMCWFKRHAGLASGLMGAAAGQVLLIGWEFAQTIWPSMYFDKNDLIATVLGGLLWALLWPKLDKWLPAA